LVFAVDTLLAKREKYNKLITSSLTFMS